MAYFYAKESIGMAYYDITFKEKFSETGFKKTLLIQTSETLFSVLPHKLAHVNSTKWDAVLRNITGFTEKLVLPC